MKLSLACVLRLVVIAMASAAAERDGAVAVRVRIAGASTPAYVALVPPDRPWRQPLAEKLTSGGSAAFNVPEGRYRILASTPGRGVAIHGPVLISHEAKNDIQLTLPAVVRVRGVVRDGEGHPLGNVTVADVNALIEAPLGRLSVLAEEHFGSHWGTTSAKDGTWELALPADAANPLVAEAPGYAPAWQASKGDTTEPIVLTLTRGAALRVQLDRTDPALVVTLAQTDGASTVPAAWQPQLWARAATHATIEWRSLPPGHYEVFAQPADRRTLAKAVRLATVTLGDAPQQEVRCELPRVETARASSMFIDAAARTRLEHVQAYGRDSSGLPKRVRHAVEQVSGGTLVHWSSDEADAPFYAVTSDAFLIAPVDAKGAATTPRAGVTDLAGGTLHVRAADDAVPLPRAGSVTFQDCNAAGSVTIPVAIAQHGNVTFPAPSSCASFVLAFAPFAPVIFTKPLPAGDPTWLGEVTLYAPSRLGVRVIDEKDSPVGDALVRVTTQGIAFGSKKSQADGWAYFDGLPPGRELLIAAAADDRTAEVRLRSEPGAVTTFGSLRLQPAASLTVAPKLARDFVSRYPDSHIEMIILDALDASAPQVRASLRDKESVVFERMRPGHWLVTALIWTGSAMQPLRGPDVEIGPGEAQRITPEFAPLVFRGRVTANGRGVAGNIDIRGTQRTDPLPSVALSDTGQFEAVLPRTGVYEVDVRVREPMRMIWIGDVAFDDPARPLELALPTGEAIVSVRSGGKPVAKATATARMQRDATQGIHRFELMPVTTDAAGKATLRQLLPGTWVVAVRDESGRMAEKRVAITNEPVAVELELTDALAIRGRVREAFGAPASGARVTCLVPAADGLPAAATTIAGDDGSFAIERRPANRNAVFCSVHSFGGVQGYRVTPGQDAELVLPSETSTLEVTGLPPLHRLSTFWLLGEDGRIVDVSPSLRTLGDSTTVLVQALAPGRWKLMRVSSLADWVALTAGGGGLLAPVVEVTLEPGGRQRMNVSP